jgi:hypothetical protein
VTNANVTAAIAEDPAAARNAAGLGTGDDVTFTNITASGTVTAAQYKETATANTTLASTVTLSLSTGTILTATLTSATPCAITLPPVVAGASFLLYLRQPASGTPTTASWAATNPVEWSGGTAPVITATLGKQDIISFVANQAGTKWFGSYIQNFTY